MAVGALFALVLFLFRGAVFQGQAFYYRDVHLQWQPQVETFVRAVASGSWPVWNPYLCFGQPLWANPNMQTLYPPTWLNFLVQPWRYYTLYVVFHFLFSGCGTYALGLRLGLSRAASLLAAAVWIAGGPFLSLVSLWNHLAGASWIPWTVLASDLALSEGRLRNTLLWGACTAAAILTGSAEAALLSTLFAALFAARRVRWRNPWAPSNRRLLRTGLAASVFAVGLSAAQWLPSLDLARRSARSRLPTGAQTFWSIHPIDLLEAFFPLSLNDLPLKTRVRATLFESREPFLPSLYLGAPAAGLVVASLCGSRRRLAFSLALAFLASLLIALGRHTPAHALLTALLPPLQSLRFPAKAMIAAAFAWSLLAGMGLDEWRRLLDAPRRGAIIAMEASLTGALTLAGIAVWTLRTRFAEVGGALLESTFTRRPFAAALAPTANRLLVTTLLTCAALLVVLARNRAGRLSAAALAGLVAADLVIADRSPTPLADAALFTIRPPALEAVASRDGSRIYVYDYSDRGAGEHHLGHPGFLPKGLHDEWPFKWAEALALRAYLFPSVVGVWGLESAYFSDPLGLFSPELHGLNWFLRAVEGTPTHTRLLRMGAVGHVVALHTRGFEDLAPIATFPTFFLEPMHVFRVRDPLPRTYAACGVRVAQGVPAVDILQDPSFEITREIILPEGPPLICDPVFSGTSRILTRKFDRIVLEATLDKPGYIVLIDGYDPGWRARLDGKAIPVLRANLVFRAVAAPAGHHVVEMVYRPPSLLIGLVLSASTLLTATAALAARARREVP